MAPKLRRCARSVRVFKEDVVGVVADLEVHPLLAYGTDDHQPRAYRYGYGILDENLNFIADPGEKRVYFEVSDHTNYIFFENPH